VSLCSKTGQFRECEHDKETGSRYPNQNAHGYEKATYDTDQGGREVVCSRECSFHPRFLPGLYHRMEKP
jgi:hypothetical protein